MRKQKTESIKSTIAYYQAQMLSKMLLVDQLEAEISRIGRRIEKLKVRQNVRQS